MGRIRLQVAIKKLDKCQQWCFPPYCLFQRCRNSHHSINMMFLKISARFTGKQLCQSLQSQRLQVSACKFAKRGTLGQVFSYKFCEIFKNTFFTGHLRATAYEDIQYINLVLFCTDF